MSRRPDTERANPAPEGPSGTADPAGPGVPGGAADPGRAGMPVGTGNFGEFFRPSVLVRPDAPALLEGDRTVTYAELDAGCDRVAAVLAARGGGPGHRVALLFNNQIEVVEATFGTMRAGAVPVPLNVKLPVDQLRRIVAHCEARVLVAGRDQGERAVRLVEGLAARDGEPVGSGGGPPHLLVDSEEPGPWESYAAAVSAASPIRRAVDVAPDDVCMQPYTSGSTGPPKGVLLTHGGTWWCVRTLRAVMLLEPEERALVAVPLYHKNGMLGAVKPFLMAGGSVVILPGFDARGALAAIERYRVTYMTGVPAMYRLMLQAANTEDRDLASLEWGIVGSAEVPRELFGEVEDRLGVRLVESYGITEGGPEVALTPRWGVRKPGWAGLVVPGAEVRIAPSGADSGEVPAGEVGELLVRSPGVAKGYYRDEAATRERFLEGGWLRTGDLACQDDDGYLKIVGRIDDMINAGGEHVFPKEVEDRLLSHALVRDACVVRQPHEIKGEVPVAFVVPEETDGSRPTEEELKRWCLERGPAFAHPRRVYFRYLLPLGTTGKVDRRALEGEARRLAAAGDGGE